MNSVRPRRHTLARASCKGGKSGLWLAGNEGMARNMETTIMGYIGFRVYGLGFRVGMKEWKRKWKLQQWG